MAWGVKWRSKSQSPDGDFFDPELVKFEIPGGVTTPESQSPDGDFFDPESSPRTSRRGKPRGVTVP